MTERNPARQRGAEAEYSSPDSDFSNLQWPLELSEYLKFDDDNNQWLHDDINPTTESFVSNQQVYNIQANQVGGGDFVEGGGSSHFEGSTSTTGISP